MIDLIIDAAQIAAVLALIVLVAVAVLVLTARPTGRYRLHYTSADGPGPEATWSVYSEDYTHVDDDEPIEGSSVWQSTWATEDEADREAVRLQRKWCGS